MSGIHKYPTISFRVSPRERAEIEAKILVSGMKKKDYFARSCIYNRVCVVGKKETVYTIVEKMAEMQAEMKALYELMLKDMTIVSSNEVLEVKESYLDMIKAIIWMLDGAEYLWKENAPNV